MVPDMIPNFLASHINRISLADTLFLCTELGGDHGKDPPTAVQVLFSLDFVIVPPKN